MKIFRVLSYAFLTLIAVGVWECEREFFLHLISDKSVIDGSVARDIEEKKDEEPVTAMEEESVLAKSSEDKVENTPPHRVVTVASDSRKQLPLASFEDGVAKIAQKLMHSVVNVATTQVIEAESVEFGDMFKGMPFGDMFKDFFGDVKQAPRRVQAVGSGFVVRVDEGKSYIVTNNHVIDKAKQIVISLYDKTELPAEVHACDPRTDIAVLVVDTKVLVKHKSKLKAIDWGDSDKLENGNWVIAIGNPFGFGNTVTHGIVSWKGRHIGIGKAPLSIVDEFIQHSAPINMGNSGGCLLDIYGRVVGVNNAIFSANGGSIGIGFAIPSNIVKFTVDQLIRNKKIMRGWFGAEVQLVTSKTAESIGLSDKNLDSSKVFGVFVVRVVEGGPAEKAGVKKGDIVLEFNGKKVDEKNSLQKIVSYEKVGEKVKVKVWRQDDSGKWGEKILDVVVGDFDKAELDGVIGSTNTGKIGQGDGPEEKEIEGLGISVSKIPEGMKKGHKEYADNLLVTSISNSKSSMLLLDLPFSPGDIIIQACNQAVKTPEQLQKIIDSVRKDPESNDKPVPFVVARGESIFIVAITIPPLENQGQKKK